MGCEQGLAFENANEALSRRVVKERTAKLS